MSHWKNTAHFITVLKLDWPIGPIAVLYILHISEITTMIFVPILLLFIWTAKKGWTIGTMLSRIRYSMVPEFIKPMGKSGRYWVRRRVMFGPRNK